MESDTEASPQFRRLPTQPKRPDVSDIAPAGEIADDMARDSSFTASVVTIQLPPPPPPQRPLPRIISYQLFAKFHELTFKNAFQGADMGNFKFTKAQVSRITVEREGHRGPPLPWSSGPGPIPRRGGDRPGAQQQQGQKKGGAGRRGFWLPPDQVRNEELMLFRDRDGTYSLGCYDISLDRRLRPVVLITHKTESCPLPLLGMNGQGPAATASSVCAAVADGSGGGGKTADNGKDPRHREGQAAAEMHEVIQEAMDVIFSERLAKRQVNQGGSGSGGSSEADGPPLVIHVNEGKWRDTKVIHLKVPTGEVGEYVRLLRQVLNEHGASIKNCDNDEGALVEVLQGQYTSLTSAYKAETLRSITSNFSLLPDAGQLLESRPEVFFPVPDQLAQLFGGEHLGAVWYGCRKYPCLVATLAGRPVNGLRMGEVLDCMAALWESDLKKQLFGLTEPGRSEETGGLQWAIVPCFAA